MKDGNHFRPARHDETSTYIGKLPSGALRDLVENEFLVLHACRALLPDDKTVEAVIAPLKDISDKALMVKRFDRLPSGTKIHFAEFNQLLGHRSGDDNRREVEARRLSSTHAPRTAANGRERSPDYEYYRLDALRCRSRRDLFGTELV